MLLPIVLTALLLQSAPTQSASTTTEWLNSSLIKTSTVNEWCRHCPDWNQTSYSFERDDGTVYVAQTHKTLDVTANGHTKLRFEKDGHVGDYIHIIDDAGKGGSCESFKGWHLRRTRYRDMGMSEKPTPTWYAIQLSKALSEAPAGEIVYPRENMKLPIGERMVGAAPGMDTETRSLKS